MDISIYDVSLVPLIIGLVAMLKASGFPNKLLPVVSIFLGVVAGIVYISPGDVPQGVLLGIAVGLSASGLYSGTKTVIEKDEK